MRNCQILKHKHQVHLRLKNNLKMKVFVEQVYTAAACNRTPEIVDWNKEGLMCFGASNAVVIYDTVVSIIFYLFFLPV